MNETILIIDDEEFIRSIARDILEMKGYTVLEAHNGQAGVDLYRERHKEVNLIILDMAMPVMRGREAFKLLKEINNDVKVILATGYAEDAHTKELLDNGARAYLEKPFRVDHLSSVIRNVLDGK